MKNFRNWEVYTRSMLLVKEAYLLSSNFPEEEKFGLISQIRRCAVSIPANIAEGAGRNSDKELKRFLYISLGSAFELETLFTLAKELNFINEEKVAQFQSELEVVMKMLNKFISVIGH
jgi:four helix bundle protein